MRKRLFTHSFARRDWRREVEDEMRLHLQLRAEVLVQQGLEPGSATAEAIRRFGPLTESRAQLLNAARHREQRMQRVEFWSTVKQDLAFAFRSFGRYKLWTAVAVTTLGLGIGSTTAVFSATSSLLLHPLPYPNSNRVVIVEQQPSEKSHNGLQLTITPSTRLVRDWIASSRSFQDLEPYQATSMQLATRDEPVTIRVGSILPSFLRFAGVHPLLGRGFTATEVADHAPVLMLSEGLWRGRFGGDPGIVGKTITLSDTVFTVIGVAPAGLMVPKSLTNPVSAWLPLNLGATNRRGASVIGRLAPGVSTGTALAELDRIAARSARANNVSEAFRTIILSPSSLIRFRQSLIILTWAVVLVLLVACTNVAHLLLARTAARKRELAIRGALGAGGGRIARQLVTESLVLTIAGAALGVMLAWAGVAAIVRLHPASLPELGLVRVDLTTLAVTGSVAVLTALAFGMLGATRSRGTHDTLKASALSTSHSRAQDRLRSALVISEMALSAVLLVGAALLIHAVIKLQNANLGFDSRGLYAIELGLREPAQTSANAAALTAARGALAAELTHGLRSAPHVAGVTTADDEPGARSFLLGGLQVEGEAPPAAGTTALIDYNAVSPSFFHVMGIRVVNGGTFTDTSASSVQVMINAGFARKHWGAASPIGRRLRIVDPSQSADASGAANWLTIVGVVQDVNTVGPTELSDGPMLYYPQTFADNVPVIMVRTDGSSDAISSLGKLVRGADPTRLHPKVTGIEAMLHESSAQPRFVTLLMTIFTGLAVILAAVGMYGVMAYGVAQRTREIGIRIALGAQASRIGRNVVLRGAVLAAVGATIGLVIASFGGRLLATELYGVSAHDPASFAVGFALLLVIAVLACIAPTRRAVRVDPVTAMRAE